MLANVFLGSTPSAKASPVTIVNYYSAHETRVMAGVFIVAFAALAFSFFLSALRPALAVAEADSGYVPQAALIGGAIYLGGLLLMDVFNVSLIDAAHYHHQTAAQTLNFLKNDGWVPVAVGLSIVALWTGVAVLRAEPYPGGRAGLQSSSASSPSPVLSGASPSFSPRCGPWRSASP